MSYEGMSGVQGWCVLRGSSGRAWVAVISPCTDATLRVVIAPALHQPSLRHEAVEGGLGHRLCHARLEGVNLTQGRKGRDAERFVWCEHYLF